MSERGFWYLHTDGSLELIVRTLLMKPIILHQTEFFNIAEHRGYQFFHHEHPTIAVLPVDMKTGKCLLRLEDLPCYQVTSIEQAQSGLRIGSTQSKHLTAVTGTANPGESLHDAMLRELLEETGIVPVSMDVETEGPMHIGKWTSMTVTFFILYLHEYTQDEALMKPDSKWEERASNEWILVDKSLEFEKDMLANYLFACVDLSLFMKDSNAQSDSAA